MSTSSTVVELISAVADALMTGDDDKLTALREFAEYWLTDAETHRAIQRLIDVAILNLEALDELERRIDDFEYPKK